MFEQFLVSGLVLGCIYALASLGFVLLYRTLGVINFGHGELLMVGAFLAVSVRGWVGGAAWLQLILLVLLMALVGVVLYLGVYRWLIGRPFINAVILTAVVGFVLVELVRVVYGPLPRSLDPMFESGPMSIGNASISGQDIAVVVTAVLAVAIIWWVLQNTSIGKTMRAMDSDFEMARVLGIRVNRVGLVVMALSAVLAGIAGFLVAPILVVTPELGAPLLLGIFVAVVIGGFGSLPGAIVGGLLVGMAEIFVAGYVSSEYQDAIVFLALIVVLLVRPNGLFGEHLEQRF